MSLERREDQHAMLLRGIANRLEGEFGELVTRDSLKRYVDDSYAEMAARSKVLTHLPAFVERFARQRLRAVARQQGQVEGHAPEVLFVCRRNDAASQIAAALFNARAGGRALAHSAGAAPAGELLDEAVHVLLEVGIETMAEFPKPITDEIVAGVDAVITLDAHDAVPIVDGKRYQAWRLADRDGQGIDGYRSLRDELQLRVDKLLVDLVPPEQIPPRVAFDQDLVDLDAELARLTDLVVEQAHRCGATLTTPAADDAGLAAAEEEVDRRHQALVTLAANLIARWQPVAVDLRHILAVSEASVHLERIGDCLYEAARSADCAALTASPEISEQLGQMADLVGTMTAVAVEALRRRDLEQVARVADDEDQLDRLYDGVFQQLVVARVNGLGLESVLIRDRVARHLERAGDHAEDISEIAAYHATGRRDRSPTSPQSGQQSEPQPTSSGMPRA